jgi:hypothetical protein
MKYLGVDGYKKKMACRDILWTKPCRIEYCFLPVPVILHLEWEEIEWFRWNTFLNGLSNIE